MITVRIVIAAAAALAAGAVSAQGAGSWLVKAGVNHIAPQVDSGTLSAPSLPNTRIDVKAASAPVISATYFYRDNLSVEAFIGTPYEHDVVGDGAIAGVGRIGKVKQLSPTVFAQYRFGAAGGLRPYAGVGLTYTTFFDEEGSGTLTGLTNPGGSPTRLKVDDAFGVSMQLGLMVPVKDRWFLDATVIKTFIKTTSKLSTGQRIDARLDPLSVMVSVGYRF